MLIAFLDYQNKQSLFLGQCTPSNFGHSYSLKKTFIPLKVQ